MCSDEFFMITADAQELSLESSANYQFCRQLINWNFRESGVLRTRNLMHNKRGERCTESDPSKCGPNPENYMIEDHVEFYIDIEEKFEGKWKPYVAEDIQLRFIMLEPYYVATLKREDPVGAPATYSYKFRVP